MEHKQNKRLALTVIIMIAATVLSKLFGLLRTVLIASRYGMGIEAVAYETASKIPLLLFDFVIGGVITTAFIPIFSGISVKKGRRRALEFTSDYFNFILIVTLIITFIGELFAKALVGFIAPDISDETALLATSLTRIMFPMVVFTGAAFCFVGILQSFGQFDVPSVISLVSNSVLIIYLLFFSGKFGIYGLSAALLIGWLLQAVFQLPWVKKYGFKWRIRLNIFTPEIAEALKNGLPILLCTWFVPVCSLINTRFASRIEDRAITAIGYSWTLFMIITGVFSYVATNLLLPKMSEMIAEEDEKRAEHFSKTSVKLLLTVIFPICAGVFILSPEIVRIIYLRGKFTFEDAAITAQALRYFSLGMPAMAANEVVLKMFFARRSFKSPTLISIFGALFNLILVYFLYKVLGVAGIGISSALMITLCAALNIIFYGREVSPVFTGKDIFDIIKCALYAALMGSGVYFVNTLLRSGDLLRTIISILAGALIYIALMIVSPTAEIKNFKIKGAK